MRSQALRHPAVAVALARGPLFLRRPLEAPGELERTVGSFGSDVLAGGVGLGGGVLREVRPVRRKVDDVHRLPLVLLRAHHPAEPARVRRRGAAGAEPVEGAFGVEHTLQLGGQGEQPACRLRRDDVAAVPVGPGVGVLQRWAEPDDLEPAQPLRCLVATHEGAWRVRARLRDLLAYGARVDGEEVSVDHQREPADLEVTDVCGRLHGTTLPASTGSVAWRRVSWWQVPTLGPAGGGGAELAATLGLFSAAASGSSDDDAQPANSPSTTTRSVAAVRCGRVTRRSSPSRWSAGCRPASRPRGTTCSRTRSRPGSSSTLPPSPSRSRANAPRTRGLLGRDRQERRA